MNNGGLVKWLTHVPFTHAFTGSNPVSVTKKIINGVKLPLSKVQNSFESPSDSLVSKQMVSVNNSRGQSRTKLFRNSRFRKVDSHSTSI